MKILLFVRASLLLVLVVIPVHVYACTYCPSVSVLNVGKIPQLNPYQKTQVSSVTEKIGMIQYTKDLQTITYSIALTLGLGSVGIALAIIFHKKRDRKDSVKFKTNPET